MNSPSDVKAIILARGGSKGIPKKNLVELHGFPLIAWTISQTIDSGIDDVYVSTDDSEIATVAVTYGAQIIDRPAKLATDLASGDKALTHAVAELSVAPDTTIVMPQATSPLRLPAHIQNITELVTSREFDSAFSANRFDDICVWTMNEPPNPLTYDYRHRDVRQKRSPLVVENGSIYATRAGSLLRYGNRLSGRIGISFMPKWTLPEIDELDDLKLCEALMTTYLSSRPQQQRSS